MTRRKSDSTAEVRVDDGRVNQETECGSVAGYLRHQHQRTEACIDCAHAWVLFSSKPNQDSNRTAYKPRVKR